ncbi:hypothetical protein BHE74_00051569, partial [Ensete ventricosum]
AGRPIALALPCCQLLAGQPVASTLPCHQTPTGRGVVMLSVAHYQVRYGSVETKCPLELVEISALPANLTEARSTFDVHLTWRLCDVAKQHDRCGGVIFLC